MTRWSPGRRGARAALTVAALLAATLGSATTLSAQDRPTRTECTCVDKDGKKIEDCTCLRTLREGDRMMAMMAPFASPRARLGVTVTVTRGAGAEADVKGARLESVTEDGPAAEAGLKAGDIVTRIDGKSLLEPLDSKAEKGFDLDQSAPVQRLLAITSELEPGQKVEVEYLRDGKALKTTVEAREMAPLDGIRIYSGDAGALADRVRTMTERMRVLRSPDGRSFELRTPEGGKTWTMPAPEGGRTWEFAAPEGGVLRVWRDSTRMDSLTGQRIRVTARPNAVFMVGAAAGLDLVEMNPGLAGYFGTGKGVLVADVEEGSTLGLQAGDVVLSVGGRAVESPDHLRRILRSYDADETLTFTVMRHQKETTVEGRLSR